MPWTCKACTLINLPSHPLCDACIHPRDFKPEDWEDDRPSHFAPRITSGPFFGEDEGEEEVEDEREDEEEDE